mgnify:FL=1
MLCQECKQKPATVHLVKIVDNHKTELHLCEDCARQRQDFMNVTPFTINDLIASFMDMQNQKAQDAASPTYEKPLAPRCTVCGLDFNQFRKTGLLGCEDCYQSFREELLPLLRRIQGNTVHTGKVPKRSGSGLVRQKKITSLKAELKKAVETEAFEKAAVLRDQIRELEQSGKDPSEAGRQKQPEDKEQNKQENDGQNKPEDKGQNKQENDYKNKQGGNGQ